MGLSGGQNLELERGLADRLDSVLVGWFRGRSLLLIGWETTGTRAVGAHGTPVPRRLMSGLRLMSLLARAGTQTV